MKKNIYLVSVSSLLKPTTMALLVCLAAFSSCSKEETSTPVNNPGNTKTPTKTELLTEKKWKLIAATVSPDMMGMSDMMAEYKDCEKDNTILFKNDASKTLVIDEEMSKCDSGDPQTSNSTWNLTNNDKDLKIGTANYKLVDLNSSSLKLSSSMTYMGTEYTMTKTYTKQ